LVCRLSGKLTANVVAVVGTTTIFATTGTSARLIRSHILGGQLADECSSPLYLACTTMRGFCRFCRFETLDNSTSYVESIGDRGSTPTPGTTRIFPVGPETIGRVFRYVSENFGKPFKRVLFTARPVPSQYSHLPVPEHFRVLVYQVCRPIAWDSESVRNCGQPGSHATR
jgi:hypothetical protein